MEAAFASPTSFAGRRLDSGRVTCPLPSDEVCGTSFPKRKACILPSMQTGVGVSGASPDANAKDRRSAFLLVDHGSKREAANDMLRSVRDTVADRLEAGAIVHYAHMEMAKPSIEEGFAQCIADGVNHVVVVPFFLAPGRHCTTDIPAMSAAAAASYPNCTFEVRAHLGSHPAVADVVVDMAMNGRPSARA